MPEFKEHAPGTFCYAELASTDPEASGKFYTDLFGWKRNDEDLGEPGIYTQFEMGGAITAAQYQLPAEQKDAGVPSFWGQYISVADCDASTTQAIELGAEAVMGPADVADYGRMTIMKDPQGALFHLWQPQKNCGVGVLNEPGAMCWNELMTTDTDSAGKFYTNLFGWGVETMEMGDMGTYTMWSRKEGGEAGGMVAIQPEMGPIPPHWLLYFAVSDADATVTKATELGAVVIVPPTDIPHAGRFAVVQDPVGAVFGVFVSKK